MRWIISAIIGVSFITAVNLWNSPGVPSSTIRSSALDNMTKEEFNRRLEYHGLHKRFSVVTCDAKSCWYQNKAKERCTF